MDPDSVAALADLTHCITAIVVFSICILGPVWLVVQYLKYKSAKKLGPDETAALDRMNRIAQRMEDRMSSVERILDAETPTWRNDGNETGARYEHAG